MILGCPVLEPEGSRIRPTFLNQRPFWGIPWLLETSSFLVPYILGVTWCNQAEISASRFTKKLLVLVIYDPSKGERIIGKGLIISYLYHMFLFLLRRRWFKNRGLKRWFVAFSFTVTHWFRYHIIILIILPGSELHCDQIHQVLMVVDVAVECVCFRGILEDKKKSEIETYVCWRPRI